MSEGADASTCTVEFTEQQLELLDGLVAAGRYGGSRQEVLAHGLSEFLRQESYHLLGVGPLLPPDAEGGRA